MSGLVWQVFRASIAPDCTPNGRRLFLRSVSIACMARRMEMNAMLVADADGCVVGLAEAHRSFLTLLFVHPEHRGRGVARGLVREIFALVPGSSPRVIHVGAALGAVGMYEHLGFRQLRPANVNDDMPSVLMRLEWDGKREF
jgi:GNAT superfamily N-acetyltransferase